MSGVAITLVGPSLSGGTGGDTVTTQEYADSTAAAAAVTNGLLPVTTPLAADGTALKKRHIPIANIREILSL